MSSRPLNTFSLFGLRIHNLTMRQAVNAVTAKRRDGVCQTVCFVNVNSINLARSQAYLNDAINDADWVFADGEGLRIAASIMGVKLRDNVNGTDMLPHLCEHAVRKGLSLYLLGSDPGIAEQAAEKLKARFEGLQIAGCHHGFFDKCDSLPVIKEINDSGADIVLVGFGSPIQERWLKRHQHLLKARSALAVGGLFDFFSGRFPRAPMLMRQYGFEWLWRWLQEPRKKFHRYILGNPLFLWRCFTELYLAGGKHHVK